MTQVSQILYDAYRQSNTISINQQTLTPKQEDEALRYLNRIVKGVYGNEAGDPLQSFPVGRNHIQRPAGFPGWDAETGLLDWYVPVNMRVVLNLEQPQNLWLSPVPGDGARFAVVDASKNLDQFPCTVYGNGRMIEGQFSIDLTEADLDAEWFYRADIGNWVRSSPLTADMLFPFPEEFDFFFIIQLAISLQPSYGMNLDPQTQATFMRSQQQLRARYTQEIQVPSELGLLRMPRTAHDRNAWRDAYFWNSPNSMFNKGWPW